MDQPRLARQSLLLALGGVVSLPVAYLLMWAHSEVTGNVYLWLGLWPMLLALIALVAVLLIGTGLWSYWRHSAPSRKRTVWIVALGVLALPVVWVAVALAALFT